MKKIVRITESEINNIVKRVLNENKNGSSEFVKTMNPPTMAEIPAYQGIQNMDPRISIKDYIEEISNNVDGSGNGINDLDKNRYLGDDVFVYLKNVLNHHIKLISDSNYRDFLSAPKVDFNHDEKRVKEMEIAQNFIDSIPVHPTYVQNSPSFERHIDEPFRKLLKNISRKDLKDGNTIREGMELFILPHLAYEWKKHVVGTIGRGDRKYINTERL